MGSRNSDILFSNRPREGYIDLQVDGQLFPSWIQENFAKYKLPDIVRDGSDPCQPGKKDAVVALHKYQLFVGDYLSPNSPYRNILLYHGLGAGKTASAINMINISYYHDPDTNFIILIKAGLLHDPWETDLARFGARGPDEEDIKGVEGLRIMNNIHFVHYDSPFAGRDFADKLKQIDTRRRTVFIIDESHNFIRNVYSNMGGDGTGRAAFIYQSILEIKSQNPETRVVMISATPAINIPFEVALTFNLLRPGIFPDDENEFNRLYITKSLYPILNPQMRNTFMRRIMGLVSYYIGATPDLYAKQRLHYENYTMSPYQYKIYRIFQQEEEEATKKAVSRGGSSKLYRTYTRQSSNFVFPTVDSRVTGAKRPRPGKYRITEKQAGDLDRARKTEQTTDTAAYTAEIEHYLSVTARYLSQFMEEGGRTLSDDIVHFREGFADQWKRSFRLWWESDSPKSVMAEKMYELSPKALACCFLAHASPGKVMIYSNFVLAEGLEIISLYLRLAGFASYNSPDVLPGLGYTEYHGRVSPDERVKVKRMYNSPDNLYGERCKIILLSPSATEGIQLLAMRMEIIMEPYFTEVRIEQVIGRGVRQRSHCALPPEEREVDVYRLKVLKPSRLAEGDGVSASADVIIEDLAKSKDALIKSFTSLMREAAVDCKLFSAHNKLQGDYPCFQFPQETLLSGHAGPAYHANIREDMEHQSGLYAPGSKLQTVKVVKINAVYRLGGTADTPYSVPAPYWYHRATGIVYDYETHQPLGRANTTGDVVDKIDGDTWVFTRTVHVPRLPL